MLDALRNGRAFVTTGDLISELFITAEAAGRSASIAEILTLPDTGADVRVTIRVRDPRAANHHGDRPDVARVDLIVGEITGPVADRVRDTNPTTAVVRRFTSKEWTRSGEYLVMTHTLRDVQRPMYLRVRGTSTGPESDHRKLIRY